MIDWNRVAALRTEIGDEDFDEVAEIFVEEMDESVAGLSPTLTDRDLADACHFLKGSALNLGFYDLGRICAETEARALAGTAPSGAVDDIRTCYAQSRQLFLKGPGR